MVVSESIAVAGKEADTRERLIKAALRVFADRGIASATLREITVEAGANVAAVNYYFRSKEELTRTVLETCLRPINENRLHSLEKLVAENGDAAIPLENLLEALVRPMVEQSLDDYGGRSPVRLLLQVRALPQPLTNTILANQFDGLGAGPEAGLRQYRSHEFGGVACFPEVGVNAERFGFAVRPQRGKKFPSFGGQQGCDLFLRCVRHGIKPNGARLDAVSWESAR